MREYLHENHLKWGFGEGEWFRPRQNNEEIWRMKWSQAQQKPGTFREECIRAAKLIYEKASLPINLFFSGGKDSQVAARSFLAAKIPFIAYVTKYQDDTGLVINQTDVTRALDFCESCQIPVKVLSIDVFDFFENQMWDYSKKYHNRVPFGALYMWMADQMDGHPVMSSFRWWFHHGVNRLEPYHYFNCNDQEKISSKPWVLMTGEQKFAFWHYLMQNDREGTFEFLTYTPEQSLSFLNDPWTKKMISEASPPVMPDAHYRNIEHYYYQYCYKGYKEHTFWEAFSVPSFPSSYGFYDYTDQMQEYRTKLMSQQTSVFGWNCDEYTTLLGQLSCQGS